MALELLTGAKAGYYCPEPTHIQGTPQEQTILAYRYLLSAEPPSILTPSSKLGHRAIHNILRRARVVHFSPEMLIELFQKQIALAPPDWTMIGKMPIEEFESPPVIPPWIDPPFETTYIGFGERRPNLLVGVEEEGDAPIAALVITRDRVRPLDADPLDPGPLKWAIFGFFCFEGHIFVTFFQDDKDIHAGMPVFAARLISHALYNAEVETAHFSRKEKKALQRAGAPVTMGKPAPYYIVRQVSRYDRPEPSDEHREIDWSHRWDVRGHKRLLHKRGPLPIGAKTLSRLHARGYKVFTDAHPTADIQHELVIRKILAKQDDEWLAVKISHVKPFIKGPADKEYVPSTHVAEWSDMLDH